MKVWSFVVLSNLSSFHQRSAQSAALLLLSSDELMSRCAAGTNGQRRIKVVWGSWLKLDRGPFYIYKTVVKA